MAASVLHEHQQHGALGELLGPFRDRSEHPTVATNIMTIPEPTPKAMAKCRRQKRNMRRYTSCWSRM